MEKALCLREWGSRDTIREVEVTEIAQWAVKNEHQNSVNNICWYIFFGIKDTQI